MPRLLLVLLILAAAACNEVNKQFCDNPDHASDPRCMNTVTCIGPDTCPMNMPVCDTSDNGGTCVPCTTTEPGVCGGGMPICTTDHKCVACSTDLECKGVCLPSGACAVATDIIYVKPNGDMSPSCGTMPSNACELQKALDLAGPASTRNVLLLATGTYTVTGAMGWTLITGTATIDARDTVEIVHQTGGGSVITAMPGTHLTLLGGHVHGALTPGGNGIQALGDASLTVVNAAIDNNAGIGIQGGMGSTLKISRSTFTTNTGGAIDLGGKFVIVNNFIYNNGAQLSTIGGIQIATTMADSANQLDFNTIVRNLSQSGPGAKCDAGTFTAKNNIIWKNTPMNGMDQVSGSCKHAFSDFSTLPTGGLDGGSNITDDPMIKDELRDLHLQTGSPARDKADPGATMAIDWDGQARPQPTGERADIGADEIP